MAFSEGPDLFFLLFIISFWNNRQVEVLSLNALYNVTVTHFSTLLWEDQLKKKKIKDYKTEGILFLIACFLSGSGQKFHFSSAVWGVKRAVLHVCGATVWGQPRHEGTHLGLGRATAGPTPSLSVSFCLLSLSSRLEMSPLSYKMPPWEKHFHRFAGGACRKSSSDGLVEPWARAGEVPICLLVRWC